MVMRRIHRIECAKAAEKKRKEETAKAIKEQKSFIRKLFGK
jgi:hypothetical protein